MSVVQPVDVVDELVSLSTEADWLDVQILEAEVIGVNDELL